jgi:hypothetical protein
VPFSAAKTIGRPIRGVVTAVRARPKTFWAVALGVFALNLFLPVAVLSLARRPMDYFTFNPWLSRLPEWLASRDVPLTRKLGFVSDMALAWFTANNPVEGVEWGFVVDVPSLGRFLLTSLLFGAYFALWAYRRDQGRQCGWAPSAGRFGGVAGAFTSVLGVTTGPCSVVGCGVPVLPVVGLAVTGLSSGALALFSSLSRVASAVVLVAVASAVIWLGWLVSTLPRESRQLPSSGQV